MKKLVLIAILLNGMFGFAQSTSYKTGIGLRAGETSGLTIKQFIGGNVALEGIVGVWSHGFSGTLLFEKYAATGVQGLNFYYGGGGHVAFETAHHNWYYYQRDRYYDYRHGYVGLGVDGIVGIEYKIPPIPIAVSVDLKPFMEVTTGGSVWMSLDPGLGIKVAF